MPETLRILIVDDNAATRYSLRRVLEQQGYQVLEAGTGNQGLMALAAESVDGLILDVNLPDMSGHDIARRLRMHPATALLPIIHVSAAAIQTQDLIAGLDAGGDAYLVHPVEPGVLLATLRTLLRVRDSEVALIESERQFREIFHNVAAPIAVIDAQLRVVECNHAFVQMMGVTGGDSLGECFSAAAEQPFLEEMAAHIARRERWQSSVRMRRGRETKEIEWQISPHRVAGQGLAFVDDVTAQRSRERDGQRQLDGAIAQLVQEVAQRNKAEAALLQMHKMDALGKLTGGIAHDFNNLLTSIIFGLDMTRQRLEAGRREGVERFIEAALGSARSAASLTNRLLAFSRQQTLDAKPLDVNAEVLSLEELLRRTIGENIRIDFDLAESVETVLADRAQLQSAVLNLVINARDALPAGGDICICSHALISKGATDLEDGRYVALTVSDNGKGIDPALVSKVFDPFFTTKPLGEGTGLGLSTVYGFSRQSGGTTRVRSVPGQRTEVTILLPAFEPVSSLTDTGSALTETSYGNGQHVLLVEDMPSVRSLIAEMLRESGFRCSEAEDALQAMEVLRRDPSIEILLSDVGLPRRSGRELASDARELRPGLPVLLMTGYAEIALDRQALLAPNMDLMSKPFQLPELIQRLLLLLQSGSDSEPAL
jgi:PAS domain S-box-containing protein